MICPNCGGPVTQVSESPASCQNCDWFNASDPRWLARVEELKVALKPRQTHQERVDEWLPKVFTPEELRDHSERSLRCAEEAIELAQSCHVDRATLHRLVDYVMDRPVGESDQEIAGVLVTAYAVAYSLFVDADVAFDTEMKRIATPEIMEKIRRRQPEKRAALSRDAKLVELDRLVATGGEPVHSFLAAASVSEPQPGADCGWFEPALFDDPESRNESCTSGKPATFKNCGFGIPVCEDHKCRCTQPTQDPGFDQLNGQDRAEKIAAGDVPIDMSPEGVEGLNDLLRGKS